MAQNKLCSILVLLLLVFFQEIQCIAGRHLILEQGRNLEMKKLQTHSRRILGKDKLQEVNYVKAVDAANTVSSPPSPPTAVIGAGQAPPPKKDEDFRPTAPGHSPGVGHSIQN